MPLLSFDEIVSSLHRMNFVLSKPTNKAHLMAPEFSLCKHKDFLEPNTTIMKQLTMSITETRLLLVEYLLRDH